MTLIKILNPVGKIVFLSFLLFGTFHLASAQSDFNVNKINPLLLTDANAVIRLEEDYFEILSKSEAKLHHRFAVTILNEKGEDEHNQMVVGYDKFTKITDMEGAIYDASGKPLKKLKGSDIKDYSYGAAGDDISDARFKLVDFGKKSYPYPYTIEFNYETRDRNMMFYPKWIPINAKKNAVEKSKFKIKTPAGFVFRYKEYNGIPVLKKSSDTDGLPVYEWVLENKPVIKTESYALPDNEFLPMVLTAPSDFEIQEYAGNFNRWEDLSKFYYILNKNRDVLPAATVAEIKNVIKDSKTDREKVLALYKWMQSRTRYVSIQLGIGGWQTIDATTVANKGYGDCKALTNFMVATLKQAGIPSYAALVRAGEDAEMNPDFPSSQFNHVIACIPLPKDTIWLECTSQTTAANFMGTFTGNRQALLVMPEGGKLVSTHYYDSGQNQRNRFTNVKLDENGNGHLLVRTEYKGLQQESRERLFHNYSQEEQKKWLLNHLELPNLELDKFEYAKGKEVIPVISENLDLKVKNCATKTGPRLFVKPNLLTRSLDLPSNTSERTGDFYLPSSEYDISDSDSLSFEIPAGLKPETTLPAFQIESVFGSFVIKTAFDNNKLIYSRKMVIKGGRFAAADYPKWIDFIKKVRKADRAQVVFIETKS
ncbi:DUF3857 domain-containing transglutaminase family protein [Dyadobacter subterraneus]|uniref:DUF3857 domain-containing transglutaminase family protein n=1 Tax=Dyadobacter subterraneus TaxID=2773304 RepID=A0ABR9WIT8_9BACT|nr:DUF3857 domain-containing transglutaminase family protein [Dyadobacter subterraneus]MBE9465432.1 DUF3857 domain-containing transglutaminase family protein [Dyadobacter subterraneus]